MEEKLLVLKKLDLGLARAEVDALDPCMPLETSDPMAAQNDVLQHGSLYIRPLVRDLSKRLALTRSIHDILFICEESQIEKHIEQFKWPKFSGSLYVNVTGSKRWTNPQLGKLIAGRMGNPPVDVKSPDFRIDVFFDEGMAVCAHNGVFIEDDFESRRAHLRPAHHPSSLHPMIARALVNLTGVWDGVLVDPMCGAGGFLIEAGLMGVQCAGFDIDAEMIERARTNLAYYGVFAFLDVRDALTSTEQIEHVVTDLPYGRSTKSVDRNELYPQFLKMLEQNLTGRAVIVFPHYSKYDEYIAKTDLKKIAEFEVYVHRTLTRKVVVLTR